MLLFYRTEIEEVRSSLKRFLSKNNDEEGLGLLYIAKMQFNFLQKQYLLSKLKKALNRKQYDQLINVQMEIDLSIEDELDIDDDLDMQANLATARNVCDSIERLQTITRNVLSMKKSMFNTICDYTKPPIEIRNVIEATFILLGEDQDKLVVSYMLIIEADKSKKLFSFRVQD